MKRTTVPAACAVALFAAASALRADMGDLIVSPMYRDATVAEEAREEQRRLSVASRHGAWAELRFVVRDTDGSPVPDATVSLHDGDPQKGVTARTDADGCAVVRRICRQGAVFSVAKDGFATREGRISFAKVSDDGQRWLAGGERTQELRRIPEAHPMLARAVKMGRLPSPSARTGYDLLKDDFTPPYGDGEVADFDIFFHHASVDIFPGGGDGRRSVRLAVKPGKGTRGFTRVDDFPDAMKAPFVAPAEYGSEMIDYSALNLGTGYYGHFPDRMAARIGGGYYLFEARGRSGVLKIENLLPPYQMAPDGFTMRFLVNEEPGVRTLVAAQGRGAGTRLPVLREGEKARGGLLLFADGDDSAVFFGVEDQGGFLPARFAPSRLASLDGVRFLSIDESVSKIPASAFEGAKDLVSVTLHPGVTEIGGRAFARCTNLNLVVADRLPEFEIEADTFADAGTNLTCVFAGNYARPDSIRHDVAPWRRVVSLHESRPGACFVEGDFLFRRQDAAAKLEKYVGRPADIVSIPEKAAGLPVTGLDYGFHAGTLFARAIVFPASLSLRDCTVNFASGQEPEAVFFNGGAFGLHFGKGGVKTYVIGPVRASGYNWNRGAAEVLPPGTRPEDILGGALAETNGFVVLKRKDAACLLRHTGGDGDVMEVPAEICGLPVAELAPHLFAGRKFKKVILPSTLRKIGFCAFAGLGECRAMDIPEGVEEIGAGAFFACGTLEIRSLPATLRKVGYGAFEAMARAPALPPGVEVESPAPARQGGTKIVVRAGDAQTP